MVQLSKRYSDGGITSDYLEQRIAFQRGAIRFTPSEFYNELFGANKHINDKIEISYTDGKNTLGNYVDKNIMEKLEKIRRNL